MIVAAGAFHRQRQEDRAEGMDPVGHPLDPEFLMYRAALLRHAVEAVESRSELLVAGGFREQVPGNLPAGKLVVWQIFVKCPDHPIPPRPLGHQEIGLITVGIRVTRRIEPIKRHGFPICWRSDQAIHRSLKAGGGETLNFLRCRGKAGEIQTRPAEQPQRIRRG